MKKKSIISALLFLACSLGLQAKQYGIEISVKDGSLPSTQLFTLDEKPQITYDENHDIVLSTGGAVQFTVPYTSGMQVRFVDLSDPSSISTPEMPSVPTYSFSNDAFCLSGLKAGTEVRVMNIQGQTLSVQRIGEDGQTELSLPQGISIVSVDGWSMKINKNN